MKRRHENTVAYLAFINARVALIDEWVLQDWPVADIATTLGLEPPEVVRIVRRPGAAEGRARAAPPPQNITARLQAELARPDGSTGSGQEIHALITDALAEIQRQERVISDFSVRGPRAPGEPGPT